MPSLEENPNKQYYYAGLFITTIVLTPKEGKGEGNKVTWTEADPNGDNATFLKGASMTSDPSVESGKREYEATEVNLEEAKQIIETGFGKGTSTPLFTVHGFNTQPAEVLGFDYIFDTKSRFKDDAKLYPVPVMWAMEEGRSVYGDTQGGDAFQASLALKALVDFIPNDTFPTKSLLCHSMGNHVVFNGACAVGTPDVQFDNIFMVAADVPVDIFHEKPNESYIFKKKVRGNKRVKAENFFGMLAKKEDGTPKGKIYILWTEKDRALLVSGILLNPGDTRLGRKGPGWVDGWFRNHYDEKATRKEFRPYIEGINVGDKEFTDDSAMMHSYWWEKWAIDIYEEKCLD